MNEAVYYKSRLRCEKFSTSLKQFFIVTPPPPPNILLRYWFFHGVSSISFIVCKLCGESIQCCNKCTLLKESDIFFGIDYKSLNKTKISMLCELFSIVFLVGKFCFRLIILCPCAHTNRIYISARHISMSILLIRCFSSKYILKGKKEIPAISNKRNRYFLFQETHCARSFNGNMHETKGKIGWHFPNRVCFCVVSRHSIPWPCLLKAK